MFIDLNLQIQIHMNTSVLTVSWLPQANNQTSSKKNGEMIKWTAALYIKKAAVPQTEI